MKRQQKSGTIGPVTGFSVDVSGVSTYLDPNTLQVKARTAQDYAAAERYEMSHVGQGLELSIIPDIVNDTVTAPISNDTNTWRLDYIMNIEGGSSILCPQYFRGQG